MAVVFIEGFDHLSGSQLTQKGWNINGSSTAGRFDGNSLLLKGVTTKKNLPSTYATLIAGFAFNASNVGSIGGTDQLAFIASGTAAVRLQVNASSQLSVRNSAGTVIATGTTVLAPNTWYYIEMKAFINGASGTVEVHVNGAVEIASTVGNFGSVNIDSLQLAFPSITTGASFDDIYACDTTGSAPSNTFLGDVRVETVYPNGAGTHTQWAAAGGGSNFAQVDETPADGDTTYVFDATPGDLDTYACGDIDGGATVFGVQTNHYARKDDANLRQIAPVIRQAGTDYVGSTVTLGSSYLFYSQLYPQDPTAAAWTPSTVNADEFGVKEIA